ncbi:MAG: SDR family oxidoreductase [Byssovorax sp.]
MSTGKTDLAGRSILITGANTGIGRATAELLAARGAHVTLACRSLEKTQPVLEGIRAAGGSADGVMLDLGDLDQVRACAAGLLATDRPIHVLLNNAGLAGTRGMTKSGFELAFGTNHVGHFLLTMLLAPRLLASPSSRIVNVASKSHYQAKGINFDVLHTRTSSITGLPEYEVSKLANVLFTKELSRRLGPKGVRSYSLHPGVVASDAWRRVPWPIRPLLKLSMITNEDGARTSIYCATSPDVANQDGLYYDKCRETKPNPLADDVDLARRLWEKSVEWTGADLPS